MVFIINTLRQVDLQLHGGVERCKAITELVTLIAPRDGNPLPMKLVDRRILNGMSAPATSDNIILTRVEDEIIRTTFKDGGNKPREVM